MGRLTFKYLTEEATQTYRSWTNKEKVLFHAFNPNGKKQKWEDMCKLISHHVDAGHIKTGWIYAYGSLSSYSAERIIELAGQRRVRDSELYAVLSMMQEAIDKGYTKLGEMIMEG